MSDTFESRLAAHWQADAAAGREAYLALLTAAALGQSVDEAEAAAAIARVGRSPSQFLADREKRRGRYEQAAKAKAVPDLTAKRDEARQLVDAHKQEFTAWFATWQEKATELQAQLQNAEEQLQEATDAQRDLIHGANAPELLAETT